MAQGHPSRTHGLGSDNVLLLALVELCNTLDDQVVTLRSTTGEHDILLLRSDERSDLLSCQIDTALRLPTVSVRTRVWISVLLREKRQHSIQYSRVHRRRSLQ